MLVLTVYLRTDGTLDQDKREVGAVITLRTSRSSGLSRVLGES